MSRPRKAKKEAKRNWVETEAETDAWSARNRVANRFGFMMCACCDRTYVWDSWGPLVKKRRNRKPSESW